MSAILRIIIERTKLARNFKFPASFRHSDLTPAQNNKTQEEGGGGGPKSNETPNGDVAPKLTRDKRQSVNRTMCIGVGCKVPPMAKLSEKVNQSCI